MDQLTWYLIAIGFESVGLVVLWLQVVKQHKEIHTLMEMFKMFALNAINKIDEVDQAVKDLQSNRSEVNK